MPKALTTTKSGFVVGHALLPDEKSVKQAVHDGDTVDVSLNSFVATRFLGIDSPEVSFTLPGSTAFPSIGSAGWDRFLTDPFDVAAHGAFDPPLRAPLEAHLRSVTGAGCAANHHKHAKDAEAKLTELITADRDKDPDKFAFFMAFGLDVLDRYGRFLCFLHHDDIANKPPSYNEQMLLAGLAWPYFIWPNIKPFLNTKTVPAPTVAISNQSLDAARVAVATARTNQVGLFETADPLRLAPHELRYLARRTGPTRPGPDRWVLDITQQTHPGKLLDPQRYIEIPNPEDRLYINTEHVPLFESKGWATA